MVSRILRGNYDGVLHTIVRDLDSDVFAVEWLSPTLFVAGQRNGTISLHKLNFLKSPQRPIETYPVGAWSHPASISKIIRVDEQRILVTGMESQVCSTTYLSLCSYLR